MTSLAELASDAAFTAGWVGVRRMPERAAYAAFQRAADGLWRRRGAGVTQLEANLRRVVPTADDAHVRELSRLGMRSYLRYWCDAFRLPGWSRERILGTFRCDGRSYLDAALAQGRGVVVALPHSGNWDHAGAWAALELGRMTTVAERLKPERLFERFVEYRTTLGMEILPLGASDTFRTLLRRLGHNHVVPLLADRDLSRTGIEVEFFGQPARMPAGPALLAAMTGAPLLPATLHYEEHTAVATIYAPVEVPAAGSRDERVRAMTAAVAAVMAQGIERHPQDWHMLQPLWSADLSRSGSGG